MVTAFQAGFQEVFSFSELEEKGVMEKTEKMQKLLEMGATVRMEEMQVLVETEDQY